MDQLEKLDKLMVDVATLATDVKYIKHNIQKTSDHNTRLTVLEKSHRLICKIVYGTAAIMCMTVLGAIINLVVN